MYSRREDAEHDTRLKDEERLSAHLGLCTLHKKVFALAVVEEVLYLLVQVVTRARYDFYH